MSHSARVIARLPVELHITNEAEALSSTTQCKEDSLLVTGAASFGMSGTIEGAVHNEIAERKVSTTAVPCISELDPEHWIARHATDVLRLQARSDSIEPPTGLSRISHDHYHFPARLLRSRLIVQSQTAVSPLFQQFDFSRPSERPQTWTVGAGHIFHHGIFSLPPSASSKRCNTFCTSNTRYIDCGGNVAALTKLFICENAYC